MVYKLAVRERAEQIVARRRELEEEMARAAGDQEKYAELLKEYREIKEAAELAEEYLALLTELEETRALLSDPELRDEAEEEAERLEASLKELQRRLRRALLPPSPEDQGNAIVEIRAGAGGDEAALFAADLFRMYAKYAEHKGFSLSVVDSHPTPLGGFREIVFVVEGKGAYGLFKYEGGVHRVQRVPKTEAGGRLHTSTATVVVLPETPEEEDVEIDPSEIEIETMRAGGPGGQHQNMTDSAVRIRHKPTGLVVVARDQRSQHQNRERAMAILKAKLRALREAEKREAERRARRSLIGSGDRSEKIRTYNFPQNRVTDHRIGLTLYNLEEIMEGDLDPLISALADAEADLRMNAQ